MILSAPYKFLHCFNYYYMHCNSTNSRDPPLLLTLVCIHQNKETGAGLFAPALMEYQSQQNNSYTGHEIVTFSGIED